MFCSNYRGTTAEATIVVEESKLKIHESEVKLKEEKIKKNSDRYLVYNEMHEAMGIYFWMLTTTKNFNLKPRGINAFINTTLRYPLSWLSSDQ